jgi:hypothetical protein
MNRPSPQTMRDEMDETCQGCAKRYPGVIH